MPPDAFWIYAIVPTILVSALILVKLKQERAKEHDDLARATNQQSEINKGMEKATPRAEADRSKEPQQSRPQHCPHYLGHLYMKKGSNSTQIPNECYGCQKLLQCMYSPNVIERVYGENTATSAHNTPRST